MNTLTVADKLYGLAVLMLVCGVLIGRAWGRAINRDRRHAPCSANHDEIWRNGYEQGCDDEARSFRVSQDVPRPGDSGGRTAEASGLATMPEAIVRGHAAAGGSEPFGVTARQPADCHWPDCWDAGRCDFHGDRCGMGTDDRPADGPQIDSAALAPSPYPNARLTPAQRRRDRHKRRGEYAERKAFDPSATYDDLSPLALADGELPEPPTDLSAWWAGELAALLRDGQSGWFSEMSGSLASRMLEGL